MDSEESEANARSRVSGARLRRRGPGACLTWLPPLPQHPPPVLSGAHSVHRAVIDLCVECSLMLIGIDEFFSVKDIVKPGQTISSRSYDRRPGGKGANQATAIAKAGGQVHLSGSIGPDGTWMLPYLRDAGVNVDSVSEVAQVRQIPYTTGSVSDCTYRARLVELSSSSVYRARTASSSSRAQITRSPTPLRRLSSLLQPARPTSSYRTRSRSPTHSLI
jgi:hypothetical protein